MAATQAAADGPPSSPPSATTTSTTGARTPSMNEDATPSARSRSRASAAWSSGIRSAPCSTAARALAVLATVSGCGVRSRLANGVGTKACTLRPRQSMGTS